MARRKVKGTDHAIYSFSLPAFLGLVALLLLTILLAAYALYCQL